ncbi:MAG: ABC transporter permease, partial [Bacteroidota bacterium]
MNDTGGQNPPKWADRILRRLLNSEYLEEISGDMEEVFDENVAKMGTGKARRQYWIDTLKLLRPNLLQTSFWMRKINTRTMIMNHLRIAFRYLKKSPVNSAINVAGLSIGLTIGAIAFLYILEERSFDDFHTNGDRIYKLITQSEEGPMETNAWPVANLLQNTYPEVESAIYTRAAHPSMKVNDRNEQFSHKTFYASKDFFQMFSFNLLEGNPQTALDGPNKVVITESMKNRYFRDGALGKTLTIRDTLNFTVTGVLEDIPSNSHMQFDLLLSFDIFINMTGFKYNEGWGNFNIRNYLLLKEGTDVALFEEKISGTYDQYGSDWLKALNVDFKAGLIPLREVYLHESVSNGFGPNGSTRGINTMLLIAVFAILLACINYINLNTARSINRSKEVGIRKVSGAGKPLLIQQFLTEALLTTLLSALVSIVLIYGSLPFFNQLVEKTFVITSFYRADFILGMLGMMIAIALLSGYYPAWVLSARKPLEALKGKINHSGRGLTLRKSLIVCQFFVAAMMVLSTFLVLSQIQYMRDRDLGFKKSQVLVLDGTNLPHNPKRETLKNTLLQLPDVVSISHTNALPARPGWQGQIAYASADSDVPVDTEYMAIDDDYVTTLQLQLVAGQNFSKEKATTHADGLLINEACVLAMGWESVDAAIGQEIVSPSGHPSGRVIGVVKDYHGLGLQNDIW